MNEKAKCSRCGVELAEIQFCYPCAKGESYDRMGLRRRPLLCEPCWNIVYEEMFGTRFGRTGRESANA